MSEAEVQLRAENDELLELLDEQQLQIEELTAKIRELEQNAMIQAQSFECLQDTAEKLEKSQTESHNSSQLSIQRYTQLEEQYNELYRNYYEVFYNFCPQQAQKIETLQKDLFSAQNVLQSKESVILELHQANEATKQAIITQHAESQRIKEEQYSAQVTTLNAEITRLNLDIQHVLMNYASNAEIGDKYFDMNKGNRDGQQNEQINNVLINSIPNSFNIVTALNPANNTTSLLLDIISYLKHHKNNVTSNYTYNEGNTSLNLYQHMDKLTASEIIDIILDKLDHIAMKKEYQNERLLEINNTLQYQLTLLYNKYSNLITLVSTSSLATTPHESILLPPPTPNTSQWQDNQQSLLHLTTSAAQLSNHQSHFAPTSQSDLRPNHTSLHAEFYNHFHTSQTPMAMIPYTSSPQKIDLPVILTSLEGFIQEYIVNLNAHYASLYEQHQQSINAAHHQRMVQLEEYYKGSDIALARKAQQLAQREENLNEDIAVLKKEEIFSLEQARLALESEVANIANKQEHIKKAYKTVVAQCCDYYLEIIEQIKFENNITDSYIQTKTAAEYLSLVDAIPFDRLLEMKIIPETEQILSKIDDKIKDQIAQQLTQQSSSTQSQQCTQEFLHQKFLYKEKNEHFEPRQHLLEQKEHYVEEKQCKFKQDNILQSQITEKQTIETEQANFADQKPVFEDKSIKFQQENLKFDKKSQEKLELQQNQQQTPVISPLNTITAQNQKLSTLPNPQPLPTGMPGPNYHIEDDDLPVFSMMNLDDDFLL